MVRKKVVITEFLLKNSLVNSKTKKTFFWELKNYFYLAFNDAESLSQKERLIVTLISCGNIKPKVITRPERPSHYILT